MIPSFFDFIDILTIGVLTGLVYALMAMGLSVIFGVMRIVNFAHGELMVLGMYLAFVLFQQFGLDPIFSLPIVVAVLFVVGFLFQKYLVRHFISRPEHMQFIFIASFALVLTNLSLIVFGPDSQGINLDYSFDSFEIGEHYIDKVRVYAAAGSLVIAGLLFVFFNHSRTGKAIRACADNQAGAKVVGLNVNQIYAITFGIGVACAGAAGSLMVLLINVHPALAPDYTLLAFIIVIIGGLGSLGGALFGGILIGVSEAFAGFMLMPSLKSLFSFALLILILLLRPQGLFGRKK